MSYADLLDPELRAMRFALALPFHVPGLLRFGRRAHAFLSRGEPVSGVKLSVRVERGASVIVHLPSERTHPGAVLWLHGGGLVSGHPSQDDRRCSTFACDLGVPVVAVEYRRAPEHPFPAPLDDCAAAWRWLQDEAGALGIDPAHVVVAGASAGGGLAAALCQRLLDEGGIQPAAQLLIYPMLDDRTTRRDDLREQRFPGWSYANNRFGWGSYLGREPGGPDAPEHAVPARRASLAGLPPAWVACGGLDLFIDEDRAYAERLARDGVRCVWEEVPGAPHGFDGVCPKASASRAFWQSQIRFMREHLG